MRLLLPALALGLALPAAAQTTYGVRAGLNVSDFVGFDDEAALGGFDTSPSLGFVGGVFAEVPVTPQFAVRPEILYAQKGFTVEAFDLNRAINVDYVEVPVLARVGVPLSPTLGAGLLVGPAFAFKVNESFDDGELASFDGGDAFEAFDLGLALGVEVGSGPFFVDLRYTPGLLDIVEGDGGDGDPTVRNSVFSVTATVKLGR